MNISLKTIHQLVIFYVVSILIFYFSLDYKPFHYLYYDFFNANLTFVPEGKIEKVERYINLLDIKFFYFVPIFPLIIYSFFIILNFNKIIIPKDKKFFYTDSDLEHLKKYNINYLIAVSAGLGLYLELAIIRTHSSFFQIFAYFKNFSLLSCLLGLGVGYLLGNRKVYSLKWVLPIICIQILIMFFIKNTPFALFIQNPVIEQSAMGQGFAQGMFQFLFIYSIIIIIFIFNAMAFVPLGHLVSNLMFQNEKLVSYGWNLIGSIGGILIFSMMSLFWTGPSLWFLLGCIFLYFFQKKDLINIFITGLSLFIILLVFNLPRELNSRDIYSPYQIITYTHNSNKETIVKASNLFFQTPVKSTTAHFSNYSLPFNVVDKIPEKVLIVGSGTGNDTAAAVFAKAKSIDAVEIDPVIIELGKQYHPDKPYQSSNVRVIQNDARNFIRHTNKKYDLIMYGLLDSHTALSANGGIRLDSYVYTIEAFYEARKKLTNDGFISLSFYVGHIEHGIKIYRMLAQAFDGRKPQVYINNPDKNLKYNSFRENYYTFIIANKPNKNFSIVENEFIKQINFFDNDKFQVDLSTDNWPFFYMPVKILPKSYIFILLIIFACSFLFINKTHSINRKNFSITCFFLGAGFMLIETKGITELALIYGSTWFVISIVIGFILIMAYFANLQIIKNKKIKSSNIYLFLIASLFFGYFFTFVDISELNSISLKIIVPAILTIPIFFSGLAFSKELSIEKSVGIALSSNILGAMFGGLLEYNSMYFGFKSLYLLGIAMYLLAFIFSKERKFRLI